LLVALAVQAWGAGAQPTAQIIFLVRHAERLSDGTNDPPLTTAGQARAQALAAVLRGAGITAILTSDFQRTQRTAQPLAQALGLSPVPFGGDPDIHVAALAAAVRAHRDGAILIVGHSDTVPALIAALGGPELGNLCESSFDRLFTLTLAKGKARLVRARYGPKSADSRPDCP
jgi:broad specificity phosphatase PhoE